MTNNASPATGNLLTRIEQAGKTLGTVASILLIISVFYDYHFLLALGLSFDDIPSSLSEHVRSAFLWAPYGLVGTFAYLIGSYARTLFSKQTKDVGTEEEVNGPSFKPALFIKRIKREIWIGLIIILIMVILAFISSYNFLWVYVCILPIWFIFTAQAISNSFSALNYELIKRTILISIIFFVFLLTALSGYKDGTLMLIADKPRWEANIRTATGINKQILFGVRRFSSFAIFVSEEKFVTIVPNDSIATIRLLASPIHKELNVCRWFGLMCNLKAASAVDASAPPFLQTTQADKPAPPL